MAESVVILSDVCLDAYERRAKREGPRAMTACIRNMAGEMLTLVQAYRDLRAQVSRLKRERTKTESELMNCRARLAALTGEGLT